MKRAAVLCAVLLLAACENSWVKPGATNADFDKINDICTKKAEADFPPILKTTEQPGYVTPNKGACFGSTDLMDCLNSQDVMVPPRLITVDENKKARTLTMEQCLKDAGWMKTE